MNDQVRGALGAHRDINGMGVEGIREMDLHRYSTHSLDEIMRKLISDEYADAYWFVFNLKERPDVQ